MPDISILNKGLYNEDGVVAYYSWQEHLQKPEETILNALKERLPGMRMLDIGVGGGRTTLHFAALAKEYLGIDYSEKMIDSCKRRFPGTHGKNVNFEVRDARSMTGLRDGYFDFVLYSFNGIDCMSHPDRMKTLREIRRVCSRGGFFSFSTHNLNALLHIRISKNPVRTIRRIRDLLSMRKLARDKSYLIVKDRDVEFEAPFYYVRPPEQVKQLREAGFGNVRVFSLFTGREIREGRGFDTARDTWLYYLCNA